ncbi:MAG: agmatine deiminase family protein [Pseudomonadota bacterium]
MKRRQFTQGLSGVVLASSLTFSAGATNNNPRSLGYRLPDEAEPHERTFMQWPVSRRVYFHQSFLEAAQKTIAKVANVISEFEPVVMLMGQAHQKTARRMLAETVEIWDIPTDDLWCRDSGPVFVKNAQGHLAVTQLNFNGWGNKQHHENDGLIAERVADRLGLPVFDNGLVGEGGGVESNGQGTLIAHESSWVNRNRNRGYKVDVEKKLLDALGAEKVIWAPGIVGRDITDYHIDALARFVGPDRVLIQLPENNDDVWAQAAYETHQILSKANNAAGQKIRVIVLDDPKNPRNKSPEFVASYVNYYLCNNAVIASRFGDDEADENAFAVLSDLFPERDVVMLPVDLLGELGGGIHCATQQQPVYEP